MAYTLSNMCAKNLCKRTVLVQLIIKNVVTCFLGTQCTSNSKLKPNSEQSLPVVDSADCFISVH